MKTLKLSFILVCTFIASAFSQTNADSIIRFSDLRFHSDFEREAMYNFVKLKKDTFNLFLAIDENLTTEQAKKLFSVYKVKLDELKQDNILAKNINKRVKISYSGIHERFLKKYNSNEFFPVTFQVGTYNCVSASMLYALVFDEIRVPYKVMASSNHVYLIANPGSNSIVVETTNPNFENTIFTGEFKRQYAEYMRTSKLISEEEYKGKSTEEIFEEKYKEVKVASFNNLPGFQYYNRALMRLEKNDLEGALSLCQKAYFFYPVQQVKTLLYTNLLYEIEKCSFDKVTDIDFLSQFSRFENVDMNAVINIFSNIIRRYLQYTDKETYCELLYQRLVSQISDKKLQEEIRFNYNMQMSYQFQNSDKVEKYVSQALEIKGNYKDANIIMENYLNRKFYSIFNGQPLLDTINKLERRLNFKEKTSLMDNYRLMAYLKCASDLFEQKKTSKGEEYLLQFENACKLPINNQMIGFSIERAYHSIAIYYYNNGNKIKSKSYIERGLKFIPDSRLLKSLNY